MQTQCSPSYFINWLCEGRGGGVQLIVYGARGSTFAIEHVWATHVWEEGWKSWNENKLKIIKLKYLLGTNPSLIEKPHPHTQPHNHMIADTHTHTSCLPFCVLPAYLSIFLIQNHTNKEKPLQQQIFPPL